MEGWGLVGLVVCEAGQEEKSAAWGTRGKGGGGIVQPEEPGTKQGAHKEVVGADPFRHRLLLFLHCEPHLFPLTMVPKKMVSHRVLVARTRAMATASALAGRKWLSRNLNHTLWGWDRRQQ